MERTKRVIADPRRIQANYMPQGRIRVVIPLTDIKGSLARLSGGTFLLKRGWWAYPDLETVGVIDTARKSDRFYAELFIRQPQIA